MGKNFILLASVVTGECYCSMDEFWNNVGNDYEKVCKQVSKTQDLNKIREIVNNYI